MESCSSPRRAPVTHSSLVLLCAALSAAAIPAGAQQYPSKPVRIVVSFAAGGPTDVIARVIAQDMTASLGQSVIVENRTGANAIIATDLVARAAPDGYTTLFSSLSLLVNAILSPDKIKYDPFKDFAPVSNAALLPQLIVTRPSTPVNSVRELVALAKKHPGEVTYGSAGHGGSAHLSGALLETLAGVKMTHISYRGNAPALVDVMSGQLTFMFYPMIGIADHVAAGKLKVIAVGTRERHPDYPKAPTVVEAGYPGLTDTAPWVGMIAPAATPAAAVNRLSEEMRKSLARAETQARLRQLGANTVGDTPEQFREFLRKDYDRWARVIKAAGIKAE
jgi:tripartite-type tricarboxylate transporter receptor subunit TctC